MAEDGRTIISQFLAWMVGHVRTHIHSYTHARAYTHVLSLAWRHECHSRAARLPDAQRVDNSTSCRTLSREENCQRPLRRFYDRIMPITWLLSRATWSPSPTVLRRHVLFSRKLSADLSSREVRHTYPTRITAISGRCTSWSFWWRLKPVGTARSRATRTEETGGILLACSAITVVRKRLAGLVENLCPRLMTCLERENAVETDTAPSSIPCLSLEVRSLG